MCGRRAAQCPAATSPKHCRPSEAALGHNGNGDLDRIVVRALAAADEPAADPSMSTQKWPSNESRSTTSPSTSAMAGSSTRGRSGSSATSIFSPSRSASSGRAWAWALGYTSLAGALGILFGTLFVAFHASQGAELGLPQMIQSRAQFGFRGVVVVLFGTLFTFSASTWPIPCWWRAGSTEYSAGTKPRVTLIAAAAAALRSRSTDTTGCTGSSAGASGCACRSTPLLTLAILRGPGAGDPPCAGRIHLGRLHRAVRRQRRLQHHLCAVGFRLFPVPAAQHPPRAIIAAVFLGATSAAIWLISLGAWLATRIGASDGLVALHDAGNSVFAGFGVLMALASVTALVATMGLNAYSGMLTVVTALNSVFELAARRRGCGILAISRWRRPGSPRRSRSRRMPSRCCSPP